MTKDVTTNIPFTEEQQAAWRKEVQKEFNGRFLQIKLGMPLKEYFKVHNFFGVRVRW